MTAQEIFDEYYKKFSEEAKRTREVLKPRSYGKSYVNEFYKKSYVKEFYKNFSKLIVECVERDGVDSITTCSFDEASTYNLTALKKIFNNEEKPMAYFAVGDYLKITDAGIGCWSDRDNIGKVGKVTSTDLSARDGHYELCDKEGCSLGWYDESEVEKASEFDQVENNKENKMANLSTKIAQENLSEDDKTLLDNNLMSSDGTVYDSGAFLNFLFQKNKAEYAAKVRQLTKKEDDKTDTPQ